MQELIAKLQELWIATQAKYDALSIRERTLADETNRLNSIAADLDGKLRDFNMRQAEVLRIENIVEFAKQAEIQTKKNHTDRVLLDKAIQDFKTHKQGEESRLKERQIFLDRECKIVEDRKKNLEQELSNKLTELAEKLRK